MVILVYKCLQQWCGKRRFPCTGLRPIALQMSQSVSGSMVPKAYCPHVIFSCSQNFFSGFLHALLHSFLWIKCWELLCDPILQSCRLMFPLLNLLYIYTIYIHSDNPKQSFSLPGASAPLKFSYAIPVMLFTVVIWPTYTCCNPFQLFMFLFFYFPPSCWHLASAALSRTKHVFKLRSHCYIKKWDYCLYLWEEVSAFTTPN